jgi:hypothetical protein
MQVNIKNNKLGVPGVLGVRVVACSNQVAPTNKIKGLRGFVDP